MSVNLKEFRIAVETAGEKVMDRHEVKRGVVHFVVVEEPLHTHLSCKLTLVLIFVPSAYRGNTPSTGHGVALVMFSTFEPGIRTHSTMNNVSHSMQVVS